MANISKSIQAKLARASQLANGGHFSEAEKIVRGLVRKGGAPAEAWFLYGALRGQGGDLQESEKALRRGLALARNHVDGWINLGNTLQAQGKYADAVDALRTALGLRDNRADAWLLLGNAQDDLGDAPAAASSYRKALELQPGFATAWSNLGKVESALGGNAEAIACYRKAVALEPGLDGARQQLAGQLSDAGRLEEALAVLDHPGTTASPVLAAARAEVLDRMGDFDGARAAIAAHIDGAQASADAAIAHARFCHHSGDCELAVHHLRDVISRHGVARDTLRTAHFALARVLDRQGDHEGAFLQYRAGNEVRKRATRFDPDRHHEDSKALIRLLGSMQGAPYTSSTRLDERPVFIIGMPRSGTSLVEQIIASHPQAGGAGELTTIGRLAQSLLSGNKDFASTVAALSEDGLNDMADSYLTELAAHAEGSELRITDKMPVNFLSLPLIVRLFPRARVIHTRRDALDTCLSCYFQNFSLAYAWTADLAQLGAYYNDYRAVMAQWASAPLLPTLDLDYEALVDSPQEQTRRLLSFLDLPLDETSLNACLDYHRSRRIVNTASYDQVRQPIHARSVQRWKRYEAHLEPLIDALGTGVD